MIDPARAAAGFQATFGYRPSALAWAPGRVNLIGEHTDYNDGYVLPVAIDRGVAAAAGCTADFERSRSAVGAEDTGRGTSLRVCSAELGGPVDLPLDGPFAAAGDWTDYVAGVARELQQTAGASLAGIDLFIAGDLPIGAGLSSSAALEISLALALMAAAGIPSLDPGTLARLAQRADHEYVGIRSGLMDQLAALHGRAEHAVLIDCKTLETTAVPLPPGIRIVVCDTGIRRELARSAYNVRCAECADAAARIGRLLGRDVRALRDVTPADLETARPHLPDALARRARHVVSENARVLETVAALSSADRGAIARAMAASHASLRDDYEVSSAELDTLVEAAARAAGCWGSRLTGAGFGGCTVSLVESRAAGAFEAAVSAAFEQRFDRRPAIYRCAAADGARVICRSEPEG